MVKVQYKISKTRKKKPALPEPQAVLLSGFFDAGAHSAKRFRLTMEDGKILKGRIDESAITVEQLRDFDGRAVTIQGVLNFNSRRKPTLLEARMITLRQAGDEILGGIKTSLSIPQVWAQVKTELSGRNTAEEIWGKWPGDESIEQLLEALKA